MSVSVTKKLRFRINMNIGDSDFSEEKKQVDNSIVGAMIEKVRKFIHQAKQFRRIQKMNQDSEHSIFAVF